MKCHYCGTELHGNEIFCRYCGTRQNSTPAPEPAPVYEAPVAEVKREPVPVLQPAPAFEDQPFPWKPVTGEKLAQPVDEAPLFDFEKAAPVAAVSKLQLPTKRGLAKMIFLGILTLGIYPIVIWSRLVGEVNLTASRYDGERSMSFFGMVMLAPITLGIHSLVWIHKLCRRIGCELQRRNLGYTFGAKDFWLWNVLLCFLSSVCLCVGASLYFVGYYAYGVIWVLLIVSMLTAIGPLVFVHKLMKSMNKLNEDFNLNG